MHIIQVSLAGPTTRHGTGRSVGHTLRSRLHKRTISVLLRWMASHSALPPTSPRLLLLHRCSRWSPVLAIRACVVRVHGVHESSMGHPWVPGLATCLCACVLVHQIMRRVSPWSEGVPAPRPGPLPDSRLTRIPTRRTCASPCAPLSSRPTTVRSSSVRVALERRPLDMLSTPARIRKRTSCHTRHAVRMP